MLQCLLHYYFDIVTVSICVICDICTLYIIFTFYIECHMLLYKTYKIVMTLSFIQTILKILTLKKNTNINWTLDGTRPRLKQKNGV